MTNEEMKELKGLAASMGLYDDKNPCKRAVILGKAIKALEQEPCIQEKQANADKIDAVYIDGFKAGYSQARFDLEQEPCEDCISRQAAIDLVSTMYLGNDSNSSYRVDGDTGDTLVGKFQVMYGLSDLPSVTPKSKTGHWIEGKYKDTCDKCRCTYPKNIGFKNYCPNCGSPMFEPQERSDRE